MLKTDRIASYVESLGVEAVGYDRRYIAYFVCFNAGDYYEAHDVLENLWLERRGEDWAFYKGLIQFAGSFVHMRKQRENPAHPTHARRLAPAARLLSLALANFKCYPPRHLGLDLEHVRRIARDYLDLLTKDAFKTNPWELASRPILQLPAKASPPGDSGCVRPERG